MFAIQAVSDSTQIKTFFFLIFTVCISAVHRATLYYFWLQRLGSIQCDVNAGSPKGDKEGIANLKCFQ